MAWLGLGGSSQAFFYYDNDTDFETCFCMTGLSHHLWLPLRPPVVSSSEVKTICPPPNVAKCLIECGEKVVLYLHCQKFSLRFIEMSTYIGSCIIIFHPTFAMGSTIPKNGK